jgi:hypothetical protein
MKPINDIASALEALGGRRYVAAACGVSLAAINNWVYRGKISYRQAYKICRLAGVCGVELSDSIFERALK